MIKIFTTNKEGKIELTKEELKSLLDEAYWEGFGSNTTTYTYHSPTRTSWEPYVWSSTLTSDSIKLNTNMNVTSSIKED